MKTTTLLLSFILCILIGANAQDTALNKRIQSMSREIKPEMAIKAMHNIIRDFKLDTLKNAEEIDVLRGQVALSFLKAGNYPRFESYIHTISNKFNQTSYLDMATQTLLKNKQFNDALNTAQKTVQLYDSYKDNPLARPSYFPTGDWNRFMKMAAYPYYQSYAEALHAKGDDQKALYYQEKAQEGMELSNLMQSSVELYTQLLEANGQTTKAYEILLEMAGLGKATLNMNAQLKRLTIKKMGDETLATHFLDSIQTRIAQKYLERVSKKMLHGLEAPDFSLQDLQGHQVSLSQLKGKVVVIDFWATWCAPCIAAMPAMQKMAENHPEVVFLFIATKEPGTDVTTRVKSFVKKNSFPLNVLIDKPAANEPKTFPLAAAYQLKGLPTKVVIDKKGKLRFLTEGYTSDSELTDELTAMIAIAKVQ